jgi:hypothetical protein
MALRAFSQNTRFCRCAFILRTSLPCAYAHGYKDNGATRLLTKHKVLQMIHFYYTLHGMVLCNVIEKAKQASKKLKTIFWIASLMLAMTTFADAPL